MNWNKLKNNKCPNCANVYLTRAPFSTIADFYCDKCPFRISAKKFDEIVNSLYKKPNFISDTDRLSELNNFGRTEMTEGFLEDEKEKDWDEI